jgi:nucleotide-binding universal stress UspA family protein
VAVDHAAVEAELRGWEVRLVHVQPLAFGRRALSEQRDRGAALLSELGERVRSRVPTLPVATALRVGTPTDVLVEESTTAGLTVLGNRGHGAVTELLAGSLSLHLAAHAAGPVLVVRVPAWPPGEGWANRPVLVGVDGSAGSDAALTLAFAEAKLRGCELLVVHARAKVAVPAGATGDPLAAGRLAGVVDEHDGVRVRREEVDGDPADALVRASVNAAAVVVGSRGRGALAGMLLGSVGRSLIHRAHCPVFIAHPEPTAA